jgi:hypothetical protein
VTGDWDGSLAQFGQIKAAGRELARRQRRGRPRDGAPESDRWLLGPCLQHDVEGRLRGTPKPGKAAFIDDYLPQPFLARLRP